MPHPLEPDRTEIESMMATATGFVADFVDSLATAPAVSRGTDNLATDLLGPPSERPGDLDALLATFAEAASQAVETAGPGYLAYFPAGGLFTSAVAELLAQVVNRYTTVSDLAPALVAMEEGVIRWLGHEFGLPHRAGGLITTGASSATLTALVAARTDRLGDQASTGTVYVTEHTHYCVAKAAQIAGLAPHQVRTVPVSEGHQMDPAAAAELIATDRAAGRRPFLLVGTAGTTSTGSIDPLDSLASVARREGLWFHVDGAYGGAFQLTQRGRAALDGVQRADSIALDPHKSLFLPYGTGVLLVRDVQSLRAAHGFDAPYLQDLAGPTRLPNYAELGGELTREFRGLRLWLPLHLHGVAAFRAGLDEKLDLAQQVHSSLLAMPRLEPPPPPDLTVNVFRMPGEDRRNEQLLETINASRRIFLSSTQLQGRYTLRLCVLSHRTHRRHIDEAMDIVRAATAVC